MRHIARGCSRLALLASKTEWTSTVLVSILLGSQACHCQDALAKEERLIPHKQHGLGSLPLSFFFSRSHSAGTMP